MTIQWKKAFSLMDVLIVGTLIALVGATVPLTANFKTQIFKGQDARRKGDLSSLKKVLEDFYNDKNSYPKPEEICYEDKNQLTCPICGHRETPTAISFYLAKLPCDPQSPVKDYLYQVDDLNNPTWYRIYTKLSNTDDAATNEVGCQYGCGPNPYQYNYGVASPNVDLETNNKLCSLFAKLYINPGCNICGSYDECKTNHPGKTYYLGPANGDPGCTTTCIKD